MRAFSSFIASSQDGDLYFVDNRSDRDETVDATFRVTGKAPELWYAETGNIEAGLLQNRRRPHHRALAPRAVGHGLRRLPQSRPAKPRTTLPKVTESKVADVDGPWKVSFQPDRGAPPSITLDKLISWSDSTDAGVKYFSGAGTYTKTIQAPADWFKKGSHLWIDLGDVKNLAEVTVNGKNLGVVWHTPYRVDVTSALKPGANEVSDQGHQCLGQSPDRRPAAGRNQVHLRRRETLQGQLAAAAVRIARAGGRGPRRHGKITRSAGSDGARRWGLKSRCIDAHS